MIRRTPRSTQSRSSAASDVYKRQVNYADNDCNFAVAYDKSFVKIDNSVFKNSNWLSGSVNGMIWDVCNSSFININSLTFSSINDYKSNFNGCLFAVSYTHLRAHETPEHLVCRHLLEKKKSNKH